MLRKQLCLFQCVSVKPVSSKGMISRSAGVGPLWKASIFPVPSGKKEQLEFSALGLLLKAKLFSLCFTQSDQVLYVFQWI